MSGAPLYDPVRLAAALRARGVEALLATRPSNVLYLTRYRKGGRAAALVTAADPWRPLLFVPSSDADFLLEDPMVGREDRAFGRFYRSLAESVELAPREARVASIDAESRLGAVSALDLAAEALAERGLGGAGVAVDAPLGPDAPALGGPEGDAGGALGSAILRELRAVKTGEEVERLRAAAQVAERAISESLEAVRDGARQEEIARAYRLAVVGDDAAVRMDNVSIDRGAALGNVNQPGDVAAAGSVVRYDVGAVVGGYESDLSRCFSIGPAAPRARHFHAALVEGQRAALDRLAPGVTCGELHAAAVEATRGAGVPHYERTNVGHGIGVHGDGYDAPLLAPGSDAEIEAGMVLCVETPYYELGFAGLQVEDMVLVTESGWEPLSHLPRELVELP